MLLRGAEVVVTNSSIEKAFIEAEASLRLEGMDITGDVHYQNLKGKVLNGELSFDDARREIMKYYAKGSGSS